MLTLISGIIFTSCLTLLSLVLFPVELTQKGLELGQQRDPGQMSSTWKMESGLILEVVI